MMIGAGSSTACSLSTSATPSYNREGRNNSPIFDQAGRLFDGRGRGEPPEQGCEPTLASSLALLGSGASRFGFHLKERSAIGAATTNRRMRGERVPLEVVRVDGEPVAVR